MTQLFSYIECTITCSHEQWFTHMQNLLNGLCPPDFQLELLVPSRSKVFGGKCSWTASYRSINGNIAGKVAFMRGKNIISTNIPIGSKVIAYGRYGSPNYGIFIQLGNRNCMCLKDFRIDQTPFPILELRKLNDAEEAQKHSTVMFLNRCEEDGQDTDEDNVEDEDRLDNRLFNIEYAVEAVTLDSSAIGIRTVEGIVCCVVKHMMSPPLMDRASYGCHWFVYDEEMSMEICDQAVSSLNIHDNSADAGLSCVLFAGIDAGDPQLWHMDSTGSYNQCDAKAIGAGSEGAQKNLQESYTPTMTMQEAVNLALQTLKEISNENLNFENVRVMTATPNQFLKVYNKEEVLNALSDLQ